ncbi:TlpA disulfide reductase family protein [Autumnicola musiva]|uniref:TlpA disulfide reductase family protein n=1 Tax=Autumnicola musiva TaxID=3075589 RepID=A0ABU3DAG9_9FLAO|nr:TlpA disulfide reductase family protein [Zunongwangia sp. F117]MDT0677958.1 TlpA disulfide reductase family protein [Zunongwangia sp. F117]
MKKIFFIVASCLLIIIACKDDKSSEAAAVEGFVIQGKMDTLQPSSMALLSYKQNDSTYLDSTMVKDGKFQFEGEVAHPDNANISIRHGNEFPEKSWNRDTYSFYIENSEIEITASDSIKKAEIKGSKLTNQSIEFSKVMNPYREKIQTLSRGLQGKPQDDAYMATVDTIKATGKKAEDYARKFIEDHRNSYIALQTFANYELGYNFDPKVAEAEYDKFSADVRNTPLGERVWDKIALAKKTSVGEKAIDFTQTTLEGEEFSLNSLKGKYVLIDFWASWCVPCRMENPFVVKAYNEYKDKNFEIVGISLDESKKPWEKAVEKDGLPWIHVSDLKGFKNEAAQAYGITAIPQNFLINPEGIIIDKNLRGEDVAARLSEIFKKS